MVDFSSDTLSGFTELLNASLLEKALVVASQSPPAVKGMALGNIADFQLSSVRCYPLRRVSLKV